MLKKLYNLVKEWDKKKLCEKKDSSHHRILDSFGEFGINIGPVQIYEARQTELKSIEALERYQLDVAYNPESYIGGMYSELYDSILLDKGILRWGKPITIDHILAHEYSHRLFRKFISAIEKGKEPLDVKPDRLKLVGIVENIDPLENLKKYIKSLQTKKRTEDDRRRLEFNIYFEEMFAETVALYLTEQIDGDEKWINYSKARQGIVFGKDKQFTKKLEEALYNSLFEGIFSKGLKQITIELPVLYQFSRYLFEERYLKSLPEPISQ